MPKKFIQDLIQDMSLEEKLGQMTQLSPMFLGAEESVNLTGPLNDLHARAQWMTLVGSTLNGFGAEKLMAMQDKNLAEHPHKIPLLFMADVVCGYKTVFPIALAMGCSFDPKVYETASSVAALEASASGIMLTFSPMSDLVRDPRWGRVMESPGEDPFLNAQMIAAAVRGFQGDDARATGKIASCVKHFAGYGAAEGGRDYNTVDVSMGMLRDFYLSAYKAAVDAGVMMVMTAFNTVERIPASANISLMRSLLRDEWGFKGVVISDFGAVDETITHGYSADGVEAAKNCINAGVDIEMMSAHYLNFAKTAIDDGRLDMGLIDEAVTRILELKDALGLFENPYKDASVAGEKELHRCPRHLEAARAAARKSMVLLENKNSTLPLKKSLKIGLAGPFTMDGTGGVSIYDGIVNKIPANMVVTAMTDPLGSMQDGIFDVPDCVEEAAKKLADCDVIIAAVGECLGDVGEAASKTSIRISQNQEKLIHRLKETGKPVVVVLFNGRPLEVTPFLQDCDALLEAWFLGSESGNAIADLLFGDYNPSGRLSMSFPHNVGQVPVYYNCYNTGRPNTGTSERYISRYLDCPNEALFPFGYGLSYSKFDYTDFRVEKLEGKIIASVTVTNSSEIAGIETVQLYISDVAAKVVRPVKELKGFTQLHLPPHASEIASFEITKDLLEFYDNHGKLVFEEGEFDIMVGRSSVDVNKARINVS